MVDQMWTQESAQVRVRADPPDPRFRTVARPAKVRRIVVRPGAGLGRADAERLTKPARSPGTGVGACEGLRRDPGQGRRRPQGQEPQVRRHPDARSGRLRPRALAAADEHRRAVGACLPGAAQVQGVQPSAVSRRPSSAFARSRPPASCRRSSRRSSRRSALTSARSSGWPPTRSSRLTRGCRRRSPRPSAARRRSSSTAWLRRRCASTSTSTR